MERLAAYHGTTQRDALEGALLAAQDRVAATPAKGFDLTAREGRVAANTDVL